MQGLRRTLIAVAAMTIMSAGLVAAPAMASSTESQFVAKINAERKARGQQPLESYWDLVDDARAHSKSMMAAGSIYHSSNLASVTSADWTRLGENVGMGPSVDALHQAFMDSSSHRANVLGDFNYVGVGVVTEDSTIWVTVVFMKAPAGLNGPKEEEPTEEETESASEPTPTSSGDGAADGGSRPTAPADDPTQSTSASPVTGGEPESESLESVAPMGRSRLGPSQI